MSLFSMTKRIFPLFFYFAIAVFFVAANPSPALGETCYRNVLISREQNCTGLPFVTKNLLNSSSIIGFADEAQAEIAINFLLDQIKFGPYQQCLEKQDDYQEGDPGIEENGFCGDNLCADDENQALCPQDCDCYRGVKVNHIQNGCLQKDLWVRDIIFNKTNIGFDSYGKLKTYIDGLYAKGYYFSQCIDQLWKEPLGGLKQETNSDPFIPDGTTPPGVRAKNSKPTPSSSQKMYFCLKDTGVCQPTYELYSSTVDCQANVEIYWKNAIATCYKTADECSQVCAPTKPLLKKQNSPIMARGGVALTFDDAYINEWYNLMGLFNKYGAKATFFISSFETTAGQPKNLAKLKDMAARGNEIGIHTYGHANAQSFISQNGLQAYSSQQIEPAIKIISQNIAKPKSFAYPYNSRTAQADSVLLQFFQNIRTGSSNRELKLKNNDEVFYVLGSGKRIFSGAGIDNYYKNSVQDVIDALKRAKDNGTVLVLYAHKPGDIGDFYIPTKKLEAILKYVREQNMAFYTVGELK